jgi:nitroreductase
LLNPTIKVNIPAMELTEAVRRRRMVRAFSPAPLPEGALDRMLALTLRAPSAGNARGTELLVLSGADQTERFWAAAWPSGRRDGRSAAPVVVVPLAGRAAYQQRYAEDDKAASPPARWPVPYWQLDAGFVTMVLLLAAVDEGLAASFFGVDAEGVRRAFGVPDGYLPIGAVAIGWPAAGQRSGPSRAAPGRPRVHRGGWGGSG